MNSHIKKLIDEKGSGIVVSYELRKPQNGPVVEVYCSLEEALEAQKKNPKLELAIIRQAVVEGVLYTLKPSEWD
ncbi:MAG: hypothetical protein JSS83_18960 [Cyanobacteria bacterium SZAS LIN-3]|nr:hypothetical protein [Cyanobacteria bacterium SZAS LIN-3]MBS2005496.1 hypothetical protein [Cyanobacteria bacterium SZAS TMP-1]